MGTQVPIKMFLNISISFWAIQIPERPDQSDRALMGFCSHRCCSLSASDGPEGTSALLLGALQMEGGLGWI